MPWSRYSFNRRCLGPAQEHLQLRPYRSQLASPQRLLCQSAEMWVVGLLSREHEQLTLVRTRSKKHRGFSLTQVQVLPAILQTAHHEYRWEKPPTYPGAHRRLEKNSYARVPGQRALTQTECHQHHFPSNERAPSHLERRIFR